MAANFVYSTREHKFILKEWLDMSKVFGQGRFEGGYSLDEVDSILENAMKIAKEVVAPTNEDGDKQHAVYKNGKVTTPESFKKPYWTVQENGLGSSNADHSDPSALPLCLMGCTNEYLAAANAASGPYVMATTGASGLIRDFGNEKVKNIFLPKMFSGQWAGTMDLTEPNSGSDVGDIITKATPTDEPGVYKIVGTKCFITGGDQDITENIVHLTLAASKAAFRARKASPCLSFPNTGTLPKAKKVSSMMSTAAVWNTRWVFADRQPASSTLGKKASAAAICWVTRPRTARARAWPRCSR